MTYLIAILAVILLHFILGIPALHIMYVSFSLAAVLAIPAWCLYQRDRQNKIQENRE